ncbi:MAG: cob(I)yrinic acid a,c-diamide adenosyltransferase [Verrucomicrobiae bacterium]|nr:cob(I)yrinic acid a,c-diamide adenosyltransferase [Verrucomicrobiae bacterium]
MSIATKRGDSGSTDLMYGRRVSKADPRVGTYGAVDELNAAIGVARAHCRNPDILAIIKAVQDSLIPIMGEMATHQDDYARYEKDGFQLISPSAVDTLTAHVDRIEADLNIRFDGWAIPGEDTSPCSAFLDVARTVCRRAERKAVRFRETGGTLSEVVIHYLNRLSDLLWLLARWEDVETRQDSAK